MYWNTANNAIPLSWPLRRAKNDSSQIRRPVYIAFMYVYVCECVCMCMYVNVYVCECVCMRMYVNVYVCVCM